MRWNWLKAYQLSITTLWVLAALLFINNANAQTGVGPYALDFDGKNDHVDLGNAVPNGMLTGGSFDNGDVDQSWTFGAYVKIPQNPTDPETLFSVNPSITSLPFLFNQDRLGLVIDNNPNQQGCRFRYYQEYQILPPFPFQGQNVVNFNKDITDGEWHHIALTFAYDDRDFLFPILIDSAHIDVKLYVDGKLVGAFDEASLSTNVQIQNQDYITLGSDYNGFLIINGFSGEMDEVRYWGDVRTASEIRNTKGKTLTGTESDLVGYYPFNQKSGINVPDEANVANGIGDGTLDNMKPSPSWFTSYTIFTWEGTVDSNWNNGDNWRFGGVPKPRDRVLIPNSPNPPSKINPNKKKVEILKVGKNAKPAIGNDITVYDSLILNSILDMQNNTLTLKDGAGVRPEGGASNQYVKGKVKKIGDEAFTFPLGDSGRHARLRISAPSFTTDAFTASYKANGYSNTSSFSASSNLNNVSNVEYWTLDRVNGSSNVDVTLYWENGPYSGIQNLSSSDPVVAHWNSSSSEWENLGQTSNTGSASSGGSITVTGVSSFSPFTFGSTKGKENPLPVEFLYFKAAADQGHANLKWATASETNNKHFQVQKQIGEAWKNIGTVKGHGTTIEKQTYNFQDPDVKAGQTYYYRLKQVDFDDSYEYSDVKAVSFKGPRQGGSQGVSLYPNPVADHLNLSLNTQQDARYQVTIRTTTGRKLYRSTLSMKQGPVNPTLPVSQLQPGTYMLILRGPEETYQKRFIKQR